MIGTFICLRFCLLIGIRSIFVYGLKDNTPLVMTRSQTVKKEQFASDYCDETENTRETMSSLLGKTSPKHRAKTKEKL